MLSGAGEVDCAKLRFRTRDQRIKRAVLTPTDSI
jgi:hypothetical protein